MKFLKWLLGTVVVLTLILGLGGVALVYLVDWNDFKDTIQNQVKKQTGRDLVIAGDLSPSVFPWAGISIGEIQLANAQGYGDTPFASIDSADVKVKLLPLIKREINVRTVQLKGLQLDLQRAADGTTNWDDLLKSTTTTTTVDQAGSDAQVTKEVEGSSATIAALSVGGIEVQDAMVSWKDAASGMDATLSDFNLKTDAIELEKPFDLNVDFSVASKSMDLAADIKGGGELLIDLNDQVYSVKGFTLDTDASGGALPGGQLSARLRADITAKLSDYAVSVSSLSLAALGIQLDGSLEIASLDKEPAITGRFTSNEFSPRELLGNLGVDAPATADPAVLCKASLQLALTASPSSAALDDLTIRLDDTIFSGRASVPSLAGVIPPVRFDFAVDAIDLDRYLPPASDAAVTDVRSDAHAGEASDATDTPIELPSEMLRQLDIDGSFTVGQVTVSRLTTSDIVVPFKAAGGRLTLQDIQASLYGGRFDGTAGLDVTSDTPLYSVKLALTDINAEPLLGDLLQKDSFLSGMGRVAADITMSGNSVNALEAALDGTFDTAFADGSINGINLGYQIRRARAALTGSTLPAEEAGTVKTDFSSLAVSGTFTDGVMQSDDLDLRSPLLRVGGTGKVDLPGESVDYTLTTLITGTAQGQGGAELESLKGVKFEIPIRGSFQELATNFAGVILSGMKDNITGNLKNQARALADQEAEKLKAQAQEKADALKAEAEELSTAKQAELRQKAEEVRDQAVDQARDKLKELFR